MSIVSPTDIGENNLLHLMNDTRINLNDNRSLSATVSGCLSREPPRVVCIVRENNAVQQVIRRGCCTTRCTQKARFHIKVKPACQILFYLFSDNQFLFGLHVVCTGIVAQLLTTQIERRIKIKVYAYISSVPRAMQNHFTLTITRFECFNGIKIRPACVASDRSKAIWTNKRLISDNTLDQTDGSLSKKKKKKKKNSSINEHSSMLGKLFVRIC